MASKNQLFAAIRNDGNGRRSMGKKAWPFFLFMLFLTLTGMAGCATTPIPFSFSEDSGETAQIRFVSGNPGIRLTHFEGNELPAPEKKTHWSPISFPAGTPLKITVYARYEQDNSSNHGLFVALITSAITASRSVFGDVVFECPPLTAGREYKLAFRKGAGMPGKNFLVLTDVKTGKAIREQEFSGKE